MLEDFPGTTSEPVAQDDCHAGRNGHLWGETITVGALSLAEDVLSRDQWSRRHSGGARNGLGWTTAVVAGGWLLEFS